MTRKQDSRSRRADNAPLPQSAVAPPFDAVRALAILSAQWEQKAHAAVRTVGGDPRSLALARILKAALIAHLTGDEELERAGKEAGEFLERKHHELIAQTDTAMIPFAHADGSEWSLTVSDVEAAKGSAGGRPFAMTITINTIQWRLAEGGPVGVAAYLAEAFTSILNVLSAFVVEQGIRLDPSVDRQRLALELAPIVAARLERSPPLGDASYRPREIARRVVVEALKHVGIKPHAAERLVGSDLL